jgi:hypothetical protein
MNSYRSVFSVGGDEHGDQFNRPRQAPPAPAPTPVPTYADQYFELLGAVRNFVEGGGKYTELKEIYDRLK